MGLKEFLFGESDVEKARKKAKKQVGQWRKNLNGSDERIRELAGEYLGKWEDRARYLSNTDPDAISSMANGVHHRIQELLHDGMDGEHIAEQILQEYPDVTNLGGCSDLDYTFGPATGVSLGQRIAAVLGKRS